MAKKIGLVGEEVKPEVKPIELPVVGLPAVVSLDLKESLELLKGIKLILNSLNKVFADGKLDWSDATIVLDLAKEYEVLIAAVDGFNYINDELKNLEEHEYIALAMNIFPMLKEIKKLILAIKGKKA